MLYTAVHIIILRIDELYIITNTGEVLEPL